MFSFTGDIIIDPFIGSGTTAVSDFKNGRNFIGYEINSDYIKLANDRINSIKQQKYYFKKELKKIN